MLRRRLELAERGQYAQLLREANAAELESRQASHIHQPKRQCKDPLSSAALNRAASAADRGQLRTAARILRDSRLLPPTSATAAAIEELYQTCEAAGARAIRAAAQPPPRSAGADVKAQHVREHIRCARAYAHAGPRHISALLSCPRAQQTLLRWVRMWSRPGLSDEFREPWLQAIVVGGDKGSGKARPITFEESLLKLASSVIVRSQLPMVRRAAGPRQFGVYHSGAAPQVAWEVKSHMAARPDMLYIALDVRNGFGAARREDALHTADAHCNGLSGLFRNLWASGAQPTVWMDTESGWRRALVQDGFLQGACEAPVAFAFALRAALDAFEQRRLTDPELADMHYRIWAYVDDMTLQVPVQKASTFLHLLREVLSEYGLHLHADKCTAHCPDGAANPEIETASVGAVDGLAEYTPEGLHILGTVADGEFRVLTHAGPDVGPESPNRTPAIEKRLEAASGLLQKLRSLLTAQIPDRCLAPAWKILAIVCNNALAYDCCVSSPGALAPYAQSLDRKVADLVPLFTGDLAVRAETLERCRLPRVAGGCDLPSTTQRARTAFLSQYLAIAPNVCRDLVRDGLTPIEATAAIRAAGFISAAQTCLTELNHEGLHLDAYGIPSERPAAQPLDIAAVASPGQPTLRHRQRLWRIPLAKATIARMRDTTLQKDLMDLGGDENGMWLTVNAGPDLAPLDDLEFRTNFRLRLGLAVMQPGLCQHRRKPTATCRVGRRCLGLCDAYGAHALDCMIGGARIILHNVGCDILFNACRDAGFGAQTEVVVPALATPKLTEPRIDVDAWGHPGYPHLRIDFTVAGNAAKRYQQAIATPAQAAETAERGKRNKYGAAAAGGVQVSGAALELKGRHGPGLDQLLRTLAGLARAKATQKGSEPKRLLQQWRARISVALARFCYAAIASAADTAPHFASEGERLAQEAAPALSALSAPRGLEA